MVFHMAFKNYTVIFISKMYIWAILKSTYYFFDMRMPKHFFFISLSIVSSIILPKTQWKQCRSIVNIFCTNICTFCCRRSKDGNISLFFVFVFCFCFVFVLFLFLFFFCTMNCVRQCDMLVESPEFFPSWFYFVPDYT